MRKYLSIVVDIIRRACYIPPMLTIKTTIEFDKWLSRLKDRQTLRHITARIDRLAQGHEGDSKSVKGAVSELRIDHGSGYRVYFTRRGSTIVILLCGGIKDTQQRDIKRAKNLATQMKETDHD